MTISRNLPLKIDDLVAKELLDPELLFVRIERVCKDLPDGDCDDGGAVAEDSKSWSCSRAAGEPQHRCELGPEGRHRFAGNDFLLLNLGLVGEPDTALPVGPALKEQAIGLRHAINAIR